MANWTNTLRFVSDQVVGSADIVLLLDNLLYLREKMAVRHDVATGAHDDPLISRIWGIEKYTGTIGAGGSWGLEEGVGFTVADLGTPAAGRGQVSFSIAFVSPSVAPVLQSRAAAATANSADSPAGAIWSVLWYDSAAAGFKFQASSANLTTGAWTLNSNGAKFSIACLGNQ